MFLTRFRQKEVFCQRPSEENTGLLAMTLNFSDWLTAFINSTESCVIGYNALCCKTHLSPAQRQSSNADLNLAADDMTH